MTQPPPELVNILDAHLAKVGPHMKLPAEGAPSNIYVLFVQDAERDADGSITATGSGTFQGPLNISTDERKGILYRMFPNHMPSLKDRLEAPDAPRKLLLVTCEVKTAGAENSALHHAVLGLP